MKLVRADINNFRSIDKLTLSFNHGCQALIGINESGKSNILRALHLLDPTITPSPADLRIERHDEPQVTSGYTRFVFSLSNVEIKQIYDEMLPHFCIDTINDLLVTDGVGSKNLLDWCKSRSEGLYIVSFPSNSRSATTWGLKANELLSTGWFRNKTSESIKLTIKDGGSRSVPAQGFVNVPKGVELSDALFEKAVLKDISSIAIIAVKKIVSSQLPKCLFWKYTDQYLLPSTIDVASFCATPDSCIPLKSMFELAGFKVSDLAATISKAQSQGHYRYLQILEKTANAATEHIRSVWKDYKNIRIKLEPNGTTLSPVVVDDVIPLDMANRSDGFKRFVSFLLQVSAKVRTQELRDNLILVDEPEIGLHPSGARSQMKELIQIGLSNNVVYSTHSIFMVDKSEIGRHLVVEKKMKLLLLGVLKNHEFRMKKLYIAQ